MNIKQLIKSLFFRIFSKLDHHSIVFESFPAFSDNSKAVFDEMILRGLNKKFHMVWIYKGECSCPVITNTEYVKNNNWNRLKVFRKTAKACCLVSCNDFLCSRGDYQKAIYVMHGIGLKKAGAYQPQGKIDYITGLSIDLNKVIAHELNVDESITQVTGYPRNDALLRFSRKKIDAFFDKTYDKIIVWYPTFRQHSKVSINDSTTTLPIVHDLENAKRINDAARKTNTLIVLKPHYAQDISKIKDLGLENIKIINDAFYQSNGIASYEFVGACDALITDYSSIYFDYLLCDKPIAAIWEDIDEYRKNRGFALDIDYYMKGAYKIFSVDDFIHFINSVFENKDELKMERKEIMDVAHYYKDANSAARVVDFIEQNILNQ